MLICIILCLIWDCCIHVVTRKMTHPRVFFIITYSLYFLCWYFSYMELITTEQVVWSGPLTNITIRALYEIEKQPSGKDLEVLCIVTESVW